MLRRANNFSALCLVVCLAACGGDTSKAPPDNNAADAAMADAATADVGGEPGIDGGSEGDSGGPVDAGGEPDMSGGNPDAGVDASSPDIGPDVPEARCGNGIVEADEQCDDGDTDEDDACRSDCTFTCGDGTVGANETCDTAIADGMPGACPSSCDDSLACTSDTLRGSGCTAECVYGVIAACNSGDGCCAAGCNANNDDDCAPICGNAVREMGESCDGDCPVDCDDADACTTDVLSGTAVTCDAMCTNAIVTACVNADGCCPAGCNSGNDSDCTGFCGNGFVDPGETCDGNCPLDCDDMDACTNDGRAGSDAQCDVTCSNAPVACNMDAADGCCSPSCDANSDLDCAPVCGNGVREAGEECDDGGVVAGDGCDAQCAAEPTTFRLSDLDLRDPHVYARLPFFGCSDITDSVPLNLAPAINTMIQDAIQCDGDCGDAQDDDGLLDLSFVASFRPLTQADGSGAAIDVIDADCTAPMSSTTCVPKAGGTSQATTYSNSASATCLQAIMGTTYGYTPALETSTAPCFSTAEFAFSINVGGIIIPLESVQLGSTYVGNPATTLTNGLLRGFLSEPAADGIIIPDTIAVVGGMPLSALLPGGDPPASGTPCTRNGDCTEPGEACVMGACSLKNCAAHSDLDRGPDGFSPGWWFYFNFPAEPVAMTFP